MYSSPVRFEHHTLAHLNANMITSVSERPRGKRMNDKLQPSKQHFNKAKVDTSTSDTKSVF